MQYLSEQIDSTEIEKWDKQNVVLDYQVGAGKTTFMFESLIPFYQKQNKSVLYLVNRKALKGQLETAYKKAGVQVQSYQYIETRIRNGQPLKTYDCIICDEAHYFFLDSAFNNCTYLSFQWLMQQTQSTKIFMSATCDSLTQYFEDKQISYIPYHGERDYSYIDTLTFFHGIDDIRQIVDGVPEDEKILVFTSAKNGKNLHSELKNSNFLCSESNREYDAGTMKELREFIEEKQAFPEKVLFTTIVLDNGINIVDEQVKHIVVDTFDKDTVIQCIGRRRIHDGEKINVYVNDYSASLNYQVQDTMYKYEPAQFLKQYGEQAFKQEYLFKLITIGDCLYWNTDPKSKDALCVNECKYHFFQKRLSWIDEVSGLQEQYVQAISDLLGKKSIVLNKAEMIEQMNMLFSEYLNQKLVGKEKEDFIKKLDEILTPAKRNPKWHISNQSYQKIRLMTFRYSLPYGIKESTVTKGNYKGRIAWEIIRRRVTNKTAYIIPDLKF